MWAKKEINSAGLLHAAVSVNLAKMSPGCGGNQVPAFNKVQYFLMPHTMRTMDMQEVVYLIP